MSGGHWGYSHSEVSYDVGRVEEFDYQYINCVVNEVKSDLMGLLPCGHFNDASRDVIDVANRAVERLEAVDAEVEALMVHVRRLSALVARYGEAYKIIDAFDCLYSGDIGLETLKERLEAAMNNNNGGGA